MTSSVFQPPIRPGRKKPPKEPEEEKKVEVKEPAKVLLEKAWRQTGVDLSSREVSNSVLKVGYIVCHNLLTGMEKTKDDARNPRNT